ncbi:MAG: hypothetical protein H7A55_06875 [Verrucomicrobiaceae bacterium]|nr:hypothetical protein [Verrucomicrobiaceae bacterium]
MMRTFSTILLGCLLLVMPAVAGTVSVTVNSNGGSPFTLADGSLLPTGAIIRIGMFDLSSPANLATVQFSNDFTSVDALFTPLAESIPGAGTIFQTGAIGDNIVINDLFVPGAVYGQIIDIDSTYFPSGTQLYAWVFSTDDPVTAAQWGIFSASTGWDFPIEPGSSTLATFEVDEVVRGTDTGTELRLSAVPEPAGIVLIACAAFAFAGRRRRTSTLPALQ